MGKIINSFLPVGPGQLPVWTAGERTEGWSALVCTQLGGSVFLQGSVLPQALPSQDLGRTPLTGQCPQNHPATPEGTPSSHTELTLPPPCLCGSAPAPSIDQSVPAESKRRPNQWGNDQGEPPSHPKSLCRHTYLVLVIYNRESKHRHHSWGGKEHSVMFLQIRFLQRRDLLWWQTHYRATWSADPSGSFVLKMHFAQTSQIWNSPLLWDWELQNHELQSSSSRRGSIIEQWLFTGKGNKCWWFNWGEGVPEIGCFVYVEILREYKLKIDF